VLRELYARLRGMERKTSPFINNVDANAPAHWVSPELVVQVRFSEWTRDLYLRQPAYLGPRPDKAAADVVAEFPVTG
jgi:ATP-dependent DNA ligase